MGNLSDNFSTDEFKCPCNCGSFIVSNTLIQSLQSFRELLKVPIFILSGYRCEKYNKKRDGSPKSKHILGQAADITIPALPLKTIYEYVTYVPAFYEGGIGLYPENNFIHVDVRGVIARWSRVKGDYVSIERGLARIG